ncbi:unnamed protein product, partial [Callosobruchus maculatus]
SIRYFLGSYRNPNVVETPAATFILNGPIVVRQAGRMDEHIIRDSSPAA